MGTHFSVFSIYSENHGVQAEPLNFARSSNITYVPCINLLVAEAFVGISASFTESTDKVKAMSMARRKCVVRGEPMENLPQDERLKA